jgi:hypothetical protein
MRTYMNFMLRDEWHISFISKDCTRAISGFFDVGDEETLRKIAAKLKADMKELEEGITARGAGPLQST